MQKYILDNYSLKHFSILCTVLLLSTYFALVIRVNHYKVPFNYDAHVCTHLKSPSRRTCEINLSFKAVLQDLGLEQNSPIMVHLLRKVINASIKTYTIIPLSSSDILICNNNPAIIQVPALVWVLKQTERGFLLY